jgi:RNA polymerase sigma-70 factor (ECF subfamily)
MSTVEFTASLNELTEALNAFAYNLTRDQEDAKDLYQETAYRAMTNRDKFAEGTNLKAWLFTIMKNIFINNYRKKKRKNTILDSTDNMYFINSGEDSIGNEAESNILMGELEGMVDSLNPSVKIPFAMHYEGYKYQEIADLLDLPLGTVKSRIFFARQELQDLVKKRYAKIYEFRCKKKVG